MTTLAMAKPHGDRPIKGLMAKWYAANTADFMKEFVELAQRIAGEVPRGSAVLEVAPGPGYFSIELAKLGPYAITGLDLSETMVGIATKKAAEAGLGVDFKQGSASNMPFPADSFDFLLCRAAFKNFAKPVGALQEMYRVLKPGGRGMIIDLKRNVSVDDVDRYVDGMSVSWLNRILTRQIFKRFLIKSAYTREEIHQMLAQAPFSSFEIDEAGVGLEIWMTK